LSLTNDSVKRICVFLEFQNSGKVSFFWFGLALAHGSKCGFGTGVMYLYFCVSVFPTFAQVWMCQGFGGHWPMVLEAVTGSRGSHRPALFPPTPSEVDPCLPWIGIFAQFYKYILHIGQIHFAT